MTDFVTLLNALRRPKILIRAARAGSIAASEARAPKRMRLPSGEARK